MESGVENTIPYTPNQDILTNDKSNDVTIIHDEDELTDITEVNKTKDNVTPEKRHDSLECEMCNYSFTSIENLMNHYLHTCKYSRTQFLTCQYCKRQFASNHSLKQHIVSKHKKYTFNPGLTKDSESDTNNGNATKSVTGMEIEDGKTDMNVATEMYKQTGSTTEIDTTKDSAMEINTAKDSTTDIDITKGSATGENRRDRIHCEICPTSFAKKENYRRHMQHIHTKVVPHTCLHCRRQFVYKHNLMTHISSKHKDESFPKKQSEQLHPKPKRFMTKEGYDIVRSGSSSHVTCNLCGKILKSARGLNQHISLHHENRTVGHECLTCGQKFKLKYTLFRHQKTGNCKVDDSTTKVLNNSPQTVESNKEKQQNSYRMPDDSMSSTENHTEMLSQNIIDNEENRTGKELFSYDTQQLPDGAIPPLVIVPRFQVGSEWVSSSTKQPSSTSDQINAVNTEPIPTREELISVSSKQIDVSPKPISVSPKQIDVSQIPIVVSSKPINVSPKPISVSPKPIAVSQEPISANPRPIPVSPRPITPGPEPISVRPEPSTDNQKPSPISMEIIALSPNLIHDGLQTIPVGLQQMPVSQQLANVSQKPTFISSESSSLSAQLPNANFQPSTFMPQQSMVNKQPATDHHYLGPVNQGAKQQLSIDNQQISTFMQKPSTVIHHLPSDGEQISPGSQQISTIKQQQLSVNNQKPSLNQALSSTSVNRQLSIDSQKSSTANQQLPSNNSEQAPINPQSSTVNQQCPSGYQQCQPAKQQVSILKLIIHCWPDLALGQPRIRICLCLPSVCLF